MERTRERRRRVAVPAARLRGAVGSSVRDLSTVGLVAGTPFFAVSLTRSLIPRSTLFQGLVSGVSLATGYALGVVAQWLWHCLELPIPGVRTRRRVELVAAAACVVIAAAFLWRASGWQHALRLLAAMEPVESGRPFSVALLARSRFGSTWG
jgi:uncharacterized membrane protein